MSTFVNRLYQVEGISPEINDVSDFMASLLGGDCAGEKELTFLTLRVGNRLRRTLVNITFYRNLQFHVFSHFHLLFHPGYW